MVMLADDLAGLGDAPAAALPPGSGTIPAMAGMAALTYKPIETARGLWTLYGYWNSANLAGAPLYYQWTYNQSVPRSPTTPPPPMGQFPTIDAARAAMMAQLSIQQPFLPPVPQPVVQPVVVPQNYATMPFPTIVRDELPPEPVSDFPTWAKVALGAAGVGVLALLFLRGRR